MAGGQLLNYNLEQLKKYSPAIEPDSVPTIFILYLERGELKHKMAKCNTSISLGSKSSFSLNVGRLVQRALSYLIY